MASKKDNPDVVSSDLVGPDYPEGTHPARPASEVTHSVTNLKYRDLPDDRKPDPTTIAEEQILSGDEASG